MSETATPAVIRETVLVDGEPMEVTAYLDNAIKLQGLSAPYLAGTVTSDALKRFEDGKTIHTSLVRKEVEPGVFLTRSHNLYRVRSWFSDATEKAEA